jgi:hypothetical protein
MVRQSACRVAIYQFYFVLASQLQASIEHFGPFCPLVCLQVIASKHCLLQVMKVYTKVGVSAKNTASKTFLEIQCGCVVTGISVN